MKLSIIALAGAMLAAPLLAFGSAQAVTINSTTPTWTHLVGGSNTQINVHDGNFVDVRWGVPMEWQRSGLGFDPASPPAVNEPIKTPFLLGTLQHYNNPIATGSAASSVDLDLLTNIAGASPLNQTFQYRFIINETPNVYPCQFPSGNNPCADQITFQNLDTTSAFTIGGVSYTIVLTGFSTDHGRTFTSDFISQEGSTNSAGLYAIITAATPVPEPLSVAMLSAGLLGLAVIRRPKA